MARLSRQHITGIVLAGGKASRMGTDKGLILLHDKPLVQYALDSLSHVCDHLIICANNPEYEAFGFEVVPDTHQNIGPMGGLYAGLRHSNNEHNLVLSCDMPMVDGALLEKLVSVHRDSQAVVPKTAEQMFPLCAYYHQSVMPQLEKDIGAGLHKMKLFIEKLDYTALILSSPDDQQKLFNINTPQDLRVMQYHPDFNPKKS